WGQSRILSYARREMVMRRLKAGTKQDHRANALHSYRDSSSLSHRHRACCTRPNSLRRGRIAATCIVSRVGSMNKINAICVYCESSPGTDPAFVETARDFGKILAQNGIRLVYGGGSIGLMGALASSVIDHGGAATGIIPEFLTAKERPRRLAQEQIITRDMHERKR